MKPEYSTNTADANRVGSTGGSAIQRAWMETEAGATDIGHRSLAGDRVTELPGQLRLEIKARLALEREVARLTAENTTLRASRADTRRLEWLIAHSAYVSHSRDGEVCNVWLSQDPDDDSNGAVPAQGYPQKCYYDAREAIDAAMRGPNVADQPRSP